MNRLFLANVLRDKNTAVPCAPRFRARNSSIFSSPSLFLHFSFFSFGNCEEMCDELTRVLGRARGRSSWHLFQLGPNLEEEAARGAHTSRDAEENSVGPFHRIRNQFLSLFYSFPVFVLPLGLETNLLPVQLSLPSGRPRY